MNALWRKRARTSSERRQSGDRRVPLPEVRRLRAWWNERTGSERRVLALGTVVLIGALYFLIIIEPLRLAAEQHAARLHAEQSLAAHLATVAAEVAALGGANATQARLPDGASLLAVVTATARAAGVQDRTRRMTPVGPHALNLFVEGIVFGQLAGWLAGLERDYGIATERAGIEAGSQPGVVDADLVLSVAP